MRRNPEFERLLVPAEFRLLDAGDGGRNLLEGYASVFGNVDAYHDVVEPGAFRKTIAERIAAGKVPLLDTHQWDAAHTLGTIVSAEEDSKGLRYRARLSSAPSVQDIRQKMLEGHIRRNSIGFESIRERYSRDRNGPAIRHLDEIKLYEISVVPLAANEDATIISVKAVVPFQDLPLAPRDRPWDGASAFEHVRMWAGDKMLDPGDADHDLNFAQFRRAFLWYDESAPDQLGSYKLQIADIINGQLTAVPHGIFAVAAVLQGARGGIDIGHDEAVVKHQVERYYAKMRTEFDDDSIVPPWERKSSFPVILTTGSRSGGKDRREAIDCILSNGYDIIQIREAATEILAALKHEDRRALVDYLAAQLARLELPAGPDSPPTDKATAGSQAETPALLRLRRRELELRAELTKRSIATQS